MSSLAGRATLCNLARSGADAALGVLTFDPKLPRPMDWPYPEEALG